MDKAEEFKLTVFNFEVLLRDDQIVLSQDDSSIVIALHQAEQLCSLIWKAAQEASDRRDLGF